MNPSKQNFLIVIGGPTASGKTAVAIRLAKYFDTEIISADARQFYKEMQIGTAKPGNEELNAAPHHFINSLSIHNAYDVGKFEKDALKLLDRLFLKNDIIILCGGSGLFIKAITEGLDKMPDVQPGIREQLQSLYKSSGISALQELLKEKDPEYFSAVDINNPQRLMRALEVILSAGMPFSSFHANEKGNRNFKSIKICLDADRNELYQKIDERVDQMFDAGLVEEAKELFPLRKLNALQTVGYTELFQYFENKIDLKTAKDLIKQHSRNYAKRQITWFKKDKEFKWFDPNDFDLILKFIKSEIK